VSVLRRSVRGVSVGVVISIVAVAALTLRGRMTPAGSTTADGDVVLGYTSGPPCTAGSYPNCENTTTGIYNNDNVDNTDAFQAEAVGGNGLVGESFGSGNGVGAFANTGFGLYALSHQATGGHIQTNSQFGAGAEVQIANTSNRRGALEAQTNGSGQGVLATAVSGAGVEGVSSSGPGLLGMSSSGLALKAQGRATFTSTTTFARSGKLTIAAGATQVTKTGISLSSTSLVLATIQGNVAGVWVEGVTLTTGSSGSFIIHLNKLTPTNLTVGWFIVN
jgi:hypothetical protein